VGRRRTYKDEPEWALSFSQSLGRIGQAWSGHSPKPWLPVAGVGWRAGWRVWPASSPGIVLVEAPDSLLDDLHALESQGLRITVQNATSGPAVATGNLRLALEVVGNDRPGIVRDISQVLAASGVNIEELTTGVVSGSFSGETLFRLMASLRAPDMAAMDAVRAGLELLGNELMVDIQPSPE
jgi:glycine cleavage system regulatory protein